MDIWIDTREKSRAIAKIIEYFTAQGINIISHSLPYGDYMSLDNARRVIDRKQNLNEVYKNLCHDHKRFISEVDGARKHGIEMIVLVEHGGYVTSLEKVQGWHNPQLKTSPYAWDGQRLYRVMVTIAQKYGVKWEFCRKADTGKRIIELLKENEVQHEQ